MTPSFPQDPDASTPAGEVVYPLWADSDPYFSLAQNFPSGPVTQTGSCPQVGDSEEPSLETIPSDVIETHEEADIRVFQLESEEPSGADCPMPIRGGYGVGNGDVKGGVSQAWGTYQSVSMRGVEQNANGYFIASPDCVVEINGDEGFDYIDLSDRDISYATFRESSIIVQDPTRGERFTIRYRNVAKAMFANGKMIDLP